MKRYIILANLVMAALILATPLCVFAENPRRTPAPVSIDTREYRIADNAVARATGRTWVDDTGERVYEYRAIIDSAPSYVEGEEIDTAWHKVGPNKWEAGINLFEATVSNGITKVSYGDDDLMWTPRVYVGGVEYDVIPYQEITEIEIPGGRSGVVVERQAGPQYEARVLPVDPINENYQNNTLVWDYGVCERRLRLIEGMIIETYVFEENPGADIQIRTNAVKDNGFTYETPVFAYDAQGNSIPISADKTVKADDLKTAVFPITIDPTETFTTSSSDGFIESIASPYASRQSAASGVEYDSGYYIYFGQDVGTTDRAYFFFDTASLPDSCSIISANISMRVESEPTGTDFNISVQSGMATYPHDPLEAGDYDKTHYDSNGIGNVGYNTSGMVYNTYCNVSLNTSGLNWINKSGDTKLCLRSYEDIIASTPTVAEYCCVWGYEKGDGYRSYLEVVYTSDAPPTVTTSAASYVTKTTARLNGMLVSDGGEASNVSFNYQPWYNASWNDCIEFTIDADYIDSDLTNFPVLITGAQLNTTDTDFWSVVNSSGSDIVFTSSDGVTKLNRELVSINTTTQAMECYVNVTSVDDTDDTNIYMYYNSSDIAVYNDSNSTSTWDVNYSAVYHMGDNPNTSTIQDSTANNYDGVKRASNEPLETAGTFTGDKAQYYDGGNDYIRITFNMSNLSTTVEGILDWYNLSDTGNLFQTGDTDTKNHITISSTSTQLAGGVRYENSGVDKRSIWTHTGNIVNGSWYSWATVQGSGDNRLYLNQTVRDSDTNTYSLGDIENPNFIGNNGIYSAAHNGNISEFRISSTNRSAAWVGATYYSMLQPTLFCAVTDVFTSTANQSKTTGESFYSDITGLSGSTLYAYKAEGVNSYGSAWGSWVQFTTEATCGAPTDLSAYPNATASELVWAKGVGSAYTLIRYKEGSYPSSTSDGELVYNGSFSSYVHSGLEPGTNYYYRAWGDDGTGNYSADYASALVTTFAGDSSTPSTPEAPTAPTGWFGSPDYTTMEDMPFYDIHNALADSIGMPYNTFWMGWAVINVVLCGIIFFFITKNTIIAILASAVLMALFGTASLISWWYVGIYLIIAIAFSYRAVTR